MEYKRFTDEQLSRAKNADTVEFLKAYYGFDFRQAGRYYQCVQHDSLMIYGDRKGFVWNSRDISGGDAIDLLRKVEGKSFPEAVEKRVCISKKTAALRSWKTAVLFCFLGDVCTFVCTFCTLQTFVIYAKSRNPHKHWIF